MCKHMYIYFLKKNVCIYKNNIYKCKIYKYVYAYIYIYEVKSVYIYIQMNLYIYIYMCI